MMCSPAGRAAQRTIRQAQRAGALQATKISCSSRLRLFAWQIERRLSKEEILTRYLMLAPYGGNLEGVRAASLAYFGK